MASKIKNTEVIGTLKKIAERNNGLMPPEKVVDAARPVSSVLHGYFTWDDGEAAEKCRLWEARQLISICVEYIGPENHGRETRVFVSLRDDRQKGGYRTLATVLSNATLRESLLEDALEEMNFFREKYKDLKELAVVFSAMSSAERKIRKKKKVAA